MCWFVGFVSLYDAALVVRFSDTIWEMEQNPIGRYLIAINGGDVSLFVGIKLLGTCVVLLTLVGIYLVSRRLAYPIASGVSLFQAALSCYLTL
jgi:hypothetical protein